jgi:hypothetical protein
MKFRLVIWALLWSVLALGIACKPTPPAPEAPAPLAPGPLSAQRPAVVERLERAVHYLASDELAGRDVGTPGVEMAARHIAAQIADIGLQPPPGQADYAQNFQISLGRIMGEATNLAIGDTPLERGEDYIALSFSAERGFEGEVVFAGYGIRSEEHDYDDYADIDASGKVVLVLRYEPHDAEGRSRFAKRGSSRAAALHAKAQTAAEQGAAGLLIVNPPEFHASGEHELIPLQRRFPGGTVDIPVLHITPATAAKLLAAANAPDLITLQRAIDTQAAPNSMALDGVRVRGEVELAERKVPARNVLAYLPGVGPLAREVVVVGAHYDHIGLGGPASLGQYGQIHNGADDNASGTAALIEIARKLRQAGPRERSIVFAWFTGEERGTLGSNHFIENPPVPLDRIVAMVNLDMVGRVRDNKLYTMGDGTAEVFSSLLDELATKSPLSIQSIGRGGMGPSDHMPFALRRIPVLMFFSGLHADYHKPTDTAEKINYEGLADVVDLATRFVERMASLPRQQYVDAHDAQPMMLRGPAETRVTLGVVPDYAAADATDGVRITGVVPGSPAEAAGLKDGDVVAQLGTIEVGTLQDLTAALAEFKPGDKVIVIVRRNGEKVELEAILAARGG